MSKQIVVYHQPGCGPCHAAMTWLSQNGIDFVAKDVTTDADAQQEMVALGSRSTPTIVVDGQPFIGFSPQKLAAAILG